MPFNTLPVSDPLRQLHGQVQRETAHNHLQTVVMDNTPNNSANDI